MSNQNEWKLAGGVGIDPDPIAPGQQVMTQGIGFPLRPVDNVPPEDFPKVTPDLIAQGLFMQFMEAGWVEGKYHPKGSVVTNGQWTMVASTLTLEQPYPLPVGNDQFGLGTTPAWTTPQFIGVVYSGHLYTMNEPVWARAIRVWVPTLTPDTNYRIVIVMQTPGDDLVTSVIEEPVLTAGAWTTVALFNRLLPSGTTILAYLDSLNSGSDQIVSGGWNYSGQANNGAPPAQGWNQNNARTVLRIDKTDLDSTDRTAELLGIIANSTVQFADTNNPSAFDTYRTTGAPVDAGTYIQYPVVLNDQGEGGVPEGVTTMTATVPIAQATDYVEVVGSVPDYSGDPNVTASGFLQHNGVDQGGAADSFGIDVKFETTSVPNDWSVLSFNSL